MAADTFEKEQHASVGNAIQHEIALAPRGEHTLVLQYAQLLTDDRLRCPRSLHNVGDAAGPAFSIQIVQYAQSERMRHIANNGRDTLQRLHVYQRAIWGFLIGYFHIYISIPLCYVTMERQEKFAHHDSPYCLTISVAHTIMSRTTQFLRRY